MQPTERIVYDAPQPCPYLTDRLARLPIRLPSRQLSREELETRLAKGDRRTGMYLYRTRCPGCVACEAIRIPIADFRPRRSQKRAQRAGDARLRCVIGDPVATAERVELYNRHKNLRDLNTREELSQETPESYEEFLVDTCCETLELSYFDGEQLVAVSIVDRGSQSLSAVYTYYEPTYSAVSLGTYAVLREVALCREWGLAWLYLGYYVTDCVRMNYKGLFAPHERLLQGRWQRFNESLPRAGLSQREEKTADND